MNKYFFIIYFLISTLSFSYINIYPTKFSERIDGKGISKTFKLYNNTNSVIRYRVFLEDEKNINSMSPFVEIYPKSITINPSEQKEFKIFVKADNTTKVGKYTTKLVVKQVNIPNINNNENEILTIFKLKMFGYVGPKQNPLLKKDILDFNKIKFFTKIDNESYLYTDNSGSYILDENMKKTKLPYEILNKFDNVFLYKKDENYGLLNKNMENIAYGYKSIFKANTYGIYIAYDGKHYGTIDENGKIATKFIYDRIFPYKSNYALVYKNNKFGLIDKRGRYILPPLYSEIFFSENGNYIIKKNDKYIDSNDKILNIDKIYPTLGDYPVFEKNGKLGIIDIYKLKISKNDFEELSLNIDNSVILSKESKYALINVNDFFSNIKINYDYNYVIQLAENIYTVSDDDSGLEKIINTKLKEISEKRYEDISKVNDNIFFAKKDGLIDIYTKNGGKIASVKRENIVYINDSYLILNKENGFYEIINALEEKQ